MGISDHSPVAAPTSMIFSIVDGTNGRVGLNYVRNGDFESPFYEEPLLTNSWPSEPTTQFSDQQFARALGNGALQMVSTRGGSALTLLIYQSLSPAPPDGQQCTLSFWFWPPTQNEYFHPVQKQLTHGPNNEHQNHGRAIEYVPPQVISPAQLSLSPGAANQQAGESADDSAAVGSTKSN
jgi:hypothetical protein